MRIFKMSKNKFNDYKKGVNINKPSKRERDRQFREMYSEKHNSKGHSSYMNSERPGKPPPGLKGKAIGLWYRDRNRNQEIKPMPVTLDRRKQEEIENLLCIAGSPLSNSGEFNGEEGFRKDFLDKIGITFEEKLDQTTNFEIKRDPQIDEELYKELYKKKHHSDRYKEMFQFRQTLPSYKKRNEIIDLIDKNQIIVISGETGCGKTTQVVQFVLDDYILNHKGSLYNAICTQTRRISAVSVAERIASERAEKIGESVGYVIRLESELPKKKSGTITFVTVGILIQWLQTDPSLKGVSHIFIDEVHERDIICDFVIALLKTVLAKRVDLKIILMSATLNAQLFSQYFGGIPCLEIPGFTYPVEDFYLEDVLQMIPFRFSTPVTKPYYGHRQKNIDPVFVNYIVPYVNNLGKSNLYSQAVISQLRNPECETLNIDLISTVIHHICIKEPEGAILVFLPGLSQMLDLHKCLERSKFFSSSRFIIILMHSIMSTVDQKKAFNKPPKGVRKIIISTSIAETSVTIDDVVYVVDSGRLKTKNFDLKQNVSTLEAEWETLANARQRRGRAGRTQPGKCYKLFTKAREDTFEPYPIPEMQRSRLEKVILSLKSLQLGRVEPFLEKVMDPPDPATVKLSLKLLKTLNVLDDQERLTPLGFHLAKLPLDPQTGKMILMGALFGCLDPILSVAACLNFKDPFVFVLHKEEMVHEKRRKFSRGEKSDHYMFSEVLREWEEANSEGYGPRFSYDNFVSNYNLQLLSNMKKQFARHLYSMNFIVSDDPKHPKSNVNSHNVSLIKAIICAGLYPNVAMIKKIIKTKADNKPNRIFWKTSDHPKVELHFKSLLEKIKNFESPFLVYFEKIKSSSIFIHDATMVYPMALLFFGERLDIVQDSSGEYYIRVDDMIKLKCFKKTGVLVQKLRNQLLFILESAISNPGVVDWEKEDRKTLILGAIVQLITTEDKTSLNEIAEYEVE